MRSHIHPIILSLIVFMCVAVIGSYPAIAAGTERKIIDDYVLGMMDKSSLLGVSVAIVHGDETYSQGYGVADRDKGHSVTADTLFELGSNSKAFTAVGLLLLVKQGKVDLKAPVTRYLPWTEWSYANGRVEPAVEDFLYQTSGMGSNSVILIEPSEREDALKNTVRELSEQPLWYEPGKKFLYSTGNYDVLGAIIEQVSGTSYESFMATEVLLPLGMHDSYVGREGIELGVQLSKGYKLGFFGNQRYDAPTYRGNTPAGYVASTAKEMALWLKIQLGQGENISDLLRHAVASSHLPDRRVDATLTEPYDSPFRYGGGWNVFGQGNKQYFSHSGNNPNFSSYVFFNAEKKIAVAVMGNRNTTYTYAIAQGIYDLILGKQPAEEPRDISDIVNILFTLLMCIAVLISTLLMYRMLKVIRAIQKGKRLYSGYTFRMYRNIALWISFFVFFMSAVWYIPKLLFGGYPWKFILVWAPFTTMPCMISVSMILILFISLRITSIVFPEGRQLPASRATEIYTFK